MGHSPLRAEHNIRDFNWLIAQSQCKARFRRPILLSALRQHVSPGKDKEISVQLSGGLSKNILDEWPIGDALAG